MDEIIKFNSKSKDPSIQRLSNVIKSPIYDPVFEVYFPSVENYFQGYKLRHASFKGCPMTQKEWLINLHKHKYCYKTLSDCEKLSIFCGKAAKKISGKGAYKKMNFSLDINAWNKASESVMRDAVKLKFAQNEDLKNILLSTKSSILVETPTMPWSVTKWQAKVKDGKVIGSNVLGKLLMEVRDTLKVELPDWEHEVGKSKIHVEETKKEMKEKEETEGIGSEPPVKRKCHDEIKK
eukprot:TRINITY_DN778067_c0_g1_i1.p1 TRINITY_DN778067_c0_g1~~TRINITY_DN778067_c0_g1_i1.p1  ORF type:complete len:236 (-),score=34.89 TRINITY_DN778067_c0_g1_i1:341-1048(-)